MPQGLFNALRLVLCTQPRSGSGRGCALPAGRGLPAGAKQQPAGMKANRLSGLLLFLIFIATVFQLSARAAEPSYNGKPLTEWLVELNAPPSDDEMDAGLKENLTPAQVDDRKHHQAEEAISHIGTNGLPILLDLISVGTDNRLALIRKIKSWDIRKGLLNKAIQPETIRELAVDGFEVLGTNAEPAVPELAKLLREDSECLLEVASVLNKIGPKGFMLFTNTLNTHPSSRVRDYMIWAIGHGGVADRKAISPLLINALNDPYWKIRGDAAEALGGGDASVVVPALIRTLDDGNSYPREQAYHSLGGYGPAAKDAIPKLLSLYTNHPDVFLMATLKAIDWKAAGQAEEFLINSGPLNYAHSGYTRTKLTNGLELIAGGHRHRNHYVNQPYSCQCTIT